MAIDVARSVGHLLRHQAERFGEKILFRFEGMETTFAEVEGRTNRLANALGAHGVSHSHKVAVMMPNGIDFPTVWLALAKLGAVMVPVNTRYREADLTYVLNDSGASMAIGGTEQLEMLLGSRSKCPTLKTIATLDVAPAEVIPLGEQEREAPSSLDVLAVREDLLNLQYTSGTTGFPKGCMLTHEYWLLLASTTRDYLRAGTGDVNLTAQPFYYMDPQWNTVLSIMAGIPLVILPRFSASTFWHSVGDNGVTLFYLLGTMPNYLLRQPENPDVEKAHKVRLVVCSGLVPQLHGEIEARFNCPWREGFGMTETGIDLMVPAEDEESVGSGAVGIPVPTKEAKVVDTHDEELPDGATGELLVRGKPLMLGYYNQPEATETVLRGGWLHTGDLAFKDVKGYFHIVGRLKEMIRRSGENISAAEVERVLCQHPPSRLPPFYPYRMIFEVKRSRRSFNFDPMRLEKRCYRRSFSISYDRESPLLKFPGSSNMLMSFL